MVSAVHVQMLRAAATILVLAAAAAPLAAVPQSVVDSVAGEERGREIAVEIRQALSQDGPRAAELIDPLTTLGLLYQESEDHGAAIATIEWALEVVRANYGLFSLDQLPLMQQLIFNEEARGNFAEAWDLEQESLRLVRRHPNDMRTVPVLREIADKRMEILQRYVAGEFPPQIVLGCYYGPSRNALGNCLAGSRGDVIESLLREAGRYYGGAIRTILRNERYSSDELRALEMELLRNSYRRGAYGLGRDSYRRLIAYSVANSEPWLDRVTALVESADWDLLFARGRNRSEEALETYEEAYESLAARRDVAQASIEELFAPDTPVALPTFLPNPLTGGERRESADYIDVAFEITKYGASRRVEVLDATTDASDAAQAELVRSIKRSRFRPRVTNGRVTDSAPVVVRYYLDE